MIFYVFRQIYREYHIGCSPKPTPNFTPIFCDTAGFRMIFLFLVHLSKRLKIKELKLYDTLIYSELASLSPQDTLIIDNIQRSTHQEVFPVLPVWGHFFYANKPSNATT